MIYNNSVYRFQLDRTKPAKKYTCPSCGRRKVFRRYIDMKTGELMDEKFGICDRELRCGYHLRPTSSDVPNGTELTISSKDLSRTLYDFYSERDVPDEIDKKEVIKSFCDYERNNLFKFMSHTFGQESALRVFSKYKVGTMDYFEWSGCCVFWQIDADMRVRTGKIMDYNPETGKRVKKDKESHVSWYHSRMADFYLRQCLFGEHLLFSSNEKEVRVVESEKTALILSAERPNKLIMATGGIQNLRPEVMDVLSDKKIILMPDKGHGLIRWVEKTNKNLSHLNIEVDSFLERVSSVQEGDDIADLIIQKKMRLKIPK